MCQTVASLLFQLLIDAALTFVHRRQFPFLKNNPITHRLELRTMPTLLRQNAPRPSLEQLSNPCSRTINVDEPTTRELQPIPRTFPSTICRSRSAPTTSSAYSYSLRGVAPGRNSTGNILNNIFLQTTNFTSMLAQANSNSGTTCINCKMAHEKCHCPPQLVDPLAYELSLFSKTNIQKLVEGIMRSTRSTFLILRSRQKKSKTSPSNRTSSRELISATQSLSPTNDGSSIHK